MKRSSLLGNLLAALAAAALCLALLEAALRAWGPAIGARTDPISPYGARYLPNSPFVRDEENRVRGRINNIGFHDRTFVFDIPDSVRRVGFFGDSFVEAMQVPADSTFVNRFEDGARAAGFPIDAAALGIAGSGADQSLFRCLYALDETRFDEVVYVFYLNDFFDGYLREQKPPTWPFLERDAAGAWHFSGAYQFDRASGGPARILKPLLKDFYLPAFLSYRLHLLRTKSAPGGGRFLEATSDSVLSLFARGESAPERHVAAMRHWEEVVLYWKRLCESRGTRFRIVVIPPLWQVDDSTFAAAVPAGTPRHGVSERLAAFCALEGIPLIDPARRFLEMTGGRGRDLYWGHLNFAGHRALAGILLEELRAREPVGPSP